MESNPIFSQLLLISVVWLCVMLYVLWPYERAAACPTPPKPTPPRRHRSRESKPFAGLLHKPLCDACEHAVDPRPKAPASPPPVFTFTRGRKRTINTAKQFCPDQDCSYYGWTSRGNIRSNGHPGGKPWRQFQCVACDGYFQETQGTPLHGTRVAPEKLVWAVGALCEGLGIRAVARVFEVDPNTVLAWLVEVAEHAAAFSRYFPHSIGFSGGHCRHMLRAAHPLISCRYMPCGRRLGA